MNRAQLALVPAHPLAWPSSQATAVKSSRSPRGLPPYCPRPARPQRPDPHAETSVLYQLAVCPVPPGPGLTPARGGAW